MSEPIGVMEKVFQAFARYGVSEDRAVDIVTSLQHSGILFKKRETIVAIAKPDKYLRKSFEVEAIQVTEENMADVALWCNGSIRTSAEGNSFIKVDVLRPMHPRQTMAFVKDWVLLSGIAFRVYNPVAFEKAFVLQGAGFHEREVPVVMSPETEAMVKNVSLYQILVGDEKPDNCIKISDTNGPCILKADHDVRTPGSHVSLVPCISQGEFNRLVTNNSSALPAFQAWLYIPATDENGRV